MSCDISDLPKDVQGTVGLYKHLSVSWLLAPLAQIECEQAAGTETLGVMHIIAMLKL